MRTVFLICSILRNTKTVYIRRTPGETKCMQIKTHYDRSDAAGDHLHAAVSGKQDLRKPFPNFAEAPDTPLAQADKTTDLNGRVCEKVKTMDKKEILKEKANRLPLLPGVYIMHNKDGDIIYIGKAKKLKNRVSQYFGAGNQHDSKVKAMVRQVHDFEYIVTDSEYEALVLECSLIKQHTPRYNILLKDDKGYHYIRISPGEYKTITECKQRLDDGAQYIGPYTSGYIVKETVDEVNRLFGLIQCTRKFPNDIGKGRPCLNYYIKQCCAPCRGKISAESYSELVGEAIDYIKSGKSLSVSQLTRQMEEYAENLEFEKAARIRNRITALKKIGEKQKVVASKVPYQDVVALAQHTGKICFEVFRFKEARLYDRESFTFDWSESPDSARFEFLRAFYSMRPDIPAQITIDGEIADRELIAKWLNEKSGRPVRIVAPQKGEQFRLVEMCRSNAAENLAQQIGSTGREMAALDELGRLLGLEKTPSYIESYDISNTAGSDNVAAMVVFEDGRPVKSAYRKFAIKGFSGQDDCRSMAEVISRRLQRYADDEQKTDGFGRLLDLILLDGGKGQVAAVRPVVKAFGLDIPVFGLVKDSKHRTRAITDDGSEISISQSRGAFTLCANIQEEVHRFAVTYHRNVRSKKAVSMELTSIKGIGEKKASALLKHFGSADRIKEAGIEQLEAVSGISRENAKKIFMHFHED